MSEHQFRAIVHYTGAELPLGLMSAGLPAPLTPVANRPVLEHILELLVHHQVRDVRVVLGAGQRSVEEYFGDGRRWGVRLSYTPTPTPGPSNEIGTGPSDFGRVLARCRRFVETTTLVVPGTALLDADLGTFLRAHRASGAAVTVLDHRAAAGREVFALEPGWPEEGVDLLAAARRSAPHERYDLLDPASTWRANRAALEGKVRGLRVPGSNPEDGIWIGRNVVIEPGAQVVAPVVIGDDCMVKKGCRLGPYAVVGNSVILDREAQVAESVVLNGTYVGGGVRINLSAAWKNCLIDTTSGQATLVPEEFLLGDLFKGGMWEGAYRFMNRALAAAFLVVFAPLMAGIWLSLRPWGAPLAFQWCAGEDRRRSLFRPASPGPAFRRYYFRTHGGPIERVYFAAGLCGLPQLWNILRGDMTFVGNRPVSLEQAAAYTQAWQRERFRTPVGIIGPAQVEGAGLEEEELLALEIYYATSRRVRMDLGLLFQGLLRVLRLHRLRPLKAVRA